MALGKEQSKNYLDLKAGAGSGRGMLTVLIPTLNSQDDLQVLLADLVPAAVSGLVRDVICADGGSTDATALVCEDAGARLFECGLAQAASQARSDRLLVLDTGYRFSEGWDERLGRALAEGRSRTLLLAGRRDTGFLAGLKAPPLALVAGREEIAVANVAEVAALVRRLGRGARRI